MKLWNGYLHVNIEKKKDFYLIAHFISIHLTFFEVFHFIFYKTFFSKVFIWWLIINVSKVFQRWKKYHRKWKRFIWLKCTEKKTKIVLKLLITGYHKLWVTISLSICMTMTFGTSVIFRFILCIYNKGYPSNIHAKKYIQNKLKTKKKCFCFVLKV